MTEICACADADGHPLDDNMIELKTGALIQFALVSPLIVTKLGHDTHIDAMTNIGHDLGILFQIQDDYLDLYGQRENMGKLIGGDVRENKKTFLYALAINKANPSDYKKLVKIYHSNEIGKLKKVISIYNDLGIKLFVEQKIKELSSNILEKILALKVNSSKKELFMEFIRFVSNRIR